MLVRDGPHQRQTESDPLCARLLADAKAGRRRVQQFVGEAGPAVLDREHSALGQPLEPHVDHRAVRCVAHGVAEQVDEGPVEQGVVAVDEARPAVLAGNGDAALVRERTHGRDGLLGHVAQAHLDEGGGGVAGGAQQMDVVVGQPDGALRHRADAAHRLARRLGFPFEQAGQHEDAVQRRAKVVREEVHGVGPVVDGLLHRGHVLETQHAHAARGVVDNEPRVDEVVAAGVSALGTVMRLAEQRIGIARAVELHRAQHQQGASTDRLGGLEPLAGTPVGRHDAAGSVDEQDRRGQALDHGSGELAIRVGGPERCLGHVERVRRAARAPRQGGGSQSSHRRLDRQQLLDETVHVPSRSPQREREPQQPGDPHGRHGQRCLRKDQQRPPPDRPPQRQRRGARDERHHVARQGRQQQHRQAAQQHDERHQHERLGGRRAAHDAAPDQRGSEVRGQLGLGHAPRGAIARREHVERRDHGVLARRAHDHQLAAQVAQGRRPDTQDSRVDGRELARRRPQRQQQGRRGRHDDRPRRHLERPVDDAHGREHRVFRLVASRERAVPQAQHRAIRGDVVLPTADRCRRPADRVGHGPDAEVLVAPPVPRPRSRAGSRRQRAAAPARRRARCGRRRASAAPRGCRRS